jgi:hypothetical protein
VKRWIIAAVCLGVLALLHIPAYSKATTHATETFQTQEPLDVSDVSLRNTGGETYDEYSGQIAFTLLTTHYLVDCGTALNSNEPATLTIGREETTSGQQEVEVQASTRTAALEMATEEVASWVPVGGDDSNLWSAEESCRDKLSDYRWQALFASPLGWLIALAAIFLMFGLGRGGGGGGTRTIRGRLTPNLWGGGWTFRGRG